MDIHKFGNKLLEFRQTKKLTQEELAMKLGVTPQAVSKWERGVGLPDIELLCEIGKVLDVTIDSLLGDTKDKITESGNDKEKEELLQHIIAEPVILRVGEGLVEFLLEEYKGGFKEINKIRNQMAWKLGYLLPVVRIMDSMLCGANEYQIIIYDKIMFSTHIEDVSKYDVSRMYTDLKVICIENYSLLINRQIVKNLMDNLQNKYPAVVEGIVPVKISYATIQKILSIIINQKKSIHNLVKIMELIEDNIEVGKDIDEIATEIIKII